MDSSVDKAYKNKHFPPSYFAPKTAKENPSNKSATVTNTANYPVESPSQTVQQLIASFSTLSFEPAQPDIENTPPLPCPIATLPDEVLVQVLLDTAIADLASFARLAQVCKRLAYLVATEEHIWRRICTGSEVGFGAMHYQWQRDILGGPLEDHELERHLAKVEEPAQNDQDEQIGTLLPGYR